MMKQRASDDRTGALVKTLHDTKVMGEVSAATAAPQPPQGQHAPRDHTWGCCAPAVVGVARQA